VAGASAVAAAAAPAPAARPAAPANPAPAAAPLTALEPAVDERAVLEAAEVGVAPAPAPAGFVAARDVAIPAVRAGAPTVVGAARVAPGRAEAPVRALGAEPVAALPFAVAAETEGRAEVRDEVDNAGARAVVVAPGVVVLLLLGRVARAVDVAPATGRAAPVVVRAAVPVAEPRAEGVVDEAPEAPPTLGRGLAVVDADDAPATEGRLLDAGLAAEVERLGPVAVVVFRAAVLALVPAAMDARGRFSEVVPVGVAPAVVREWEGGAAAAGRTPAGVVRAAVLVRGPVDPVVVRAEVALADGRADADVVELGRAAVPRAPATGGFVAAPVVPVVRAAAAAVARARAEVDAVPGVADVDDAEGVGRGFAPGAEAAAFVVLEAAGFVLGAFVADGAVFAGSAGAAVVFESSSVGAGSVSAGF